MAQECKECQSLMKKTSSINSSNAIIETWECTSCGNKQQVCTGLTF
jgi:DNA-directed RNA polymerase subunit M/transcription elongation factor TFIIS